MYEINKRSNKDTHFSKYVFVYSQEIKRKKKLTKNDPCESRSHDLGVISRAG